MLSKFQDLSVLLGFYISNVQDEIFFLTVALEERGFLARRFQDDLFWMNLLGCLTDGAADGESLCPAGSVRKNILKSLIFIYIYIYIHVL